VNIFEAKRQTGRTTRMMEEALKMCRQGKAVYLLFATHSESESCKHSELGQRILFLGGKFESRLENYDFGQMKLLGAHPNCTVLVDHHVLETVFKKQVEMLEQFDATNDRLTFTNALNIARGCQDYSGGYTSDNYEIYQHGIQTVINALQSAAMLGLHDPQIRTLHEIGLSGA
jgi:hypothetical protein